MYIQSFLNRASHAFLSLIFIILPSLAQADFTQGKSSIQGSFGFSRGGIALGADYEYGYDRTFGIGGYLRMYPHDNDPEANGISTIGVFVRPHFNRQSWDFYLSPGFGMISLDPYGNRDDETLMGPSFALGLLYEFNSQVSFGVEQMALYSWFGENDYLGLVSEELMAKFRFIF